MASKATETSIRTITGTLSIENGQIFIEREDEDSHTPLSEFYKQYDGKNVTITINCKFKL